MELIALTGGRFTVGAAASLDETLFSFCPDYPRELEQPAHEVSVGPFLIGKAPVTHREFRDFVEGGGYRRSELWLEIDERTSAVSRVADFVDASGKPGPLSWEDGAPPEDALDHPVHGVSYYEAAAYARFVGARLPTELEWEFAARGLSGRLFPWGQTFRGDACVYSGNSEGTAPVTGFPRGATPEGVMHLAGNVAEWTASVFSLYGRPAPGMEPPPSDEVVVRGDSFRGTALTLRGSVRSRWFPASRPLGFGFRLAKTPDLGLARSLRV